MKILKTSNLEKGYYNSVDDAINALLKYKEN